jgi:hypothetical protein
VTRHHKDAAHKPRAREMTVSHLDPESSLPPQEGGFCDLPQNQLVLGAAFHPGGEAGSEDSIIIRR